MDKFFIIGLPRSRTYWLSVFLECFHEAISVFPDYQDFMESDHPGDSTTVYSVVRKFIKNEKTIYIDRDIDEVFESANRAFGVVYSVDMLKMIQEELRKKENCLHVHYNDINDRLEEVWDYCYADKPFDAKRAEALKVINLQNKYVIELSKQEVIAAQSRRVG